MDKGIPLNIPKVAIVILHYANEEMTIRAIHCIRRYSPEDSYHIYVVDNASPEPFVLDEPDVTVIRNDDRHSVSGMNRGFHFALYEAPIPHDYIVNIDNDVYVHDGWLEPIRKEFEENPRTGICGGKQFKPNSDKFYSVGSDLSGYIYENYPTERKEVIWIQGSFHAYRASMMRDIGLHDRRFKDICSDSDYCIHAWDRGWEVIFIPDSEVTHIGGASYSKFPIERFDDFGQLISKWFGIKFNSLASVIPIDVNKSLYGKSVYKTEVLK